MPHPIVPHVVARRQQRLARAGALNSAVPAPYRQFWRDLRIGLVFDNVGSGRIPFNYGNAGQPTVVNSPEAVVTPYGQGVHWTRADSDRLEFANFATGGADAAGTMAVLYKRDNHDNIHRIGAEDFYEVRFKTDGALDLEMAQDDSGEATSTNQTVNSWVLAMVTWSRARNQGRIYIDGDINANGTANSNPSATVTYSLASRGTLDHWDGTFAGFWFWDRVFTAAEAAIFYRGPFLMYGRPRYLEVDTRVRGMVGSL